MAEDKSLKIAYLASSIIPSYSANSIQVMKMCNAFVEIGNEVTLIVPNKKAMGLELVDCFDFYGIRPNFKIEKISLLNIRGQSILYGFRSAYRAKYFNPELVYGRNVISCSIASLLGLNTMFESHSPIADSGFVSKVLFSIMIRRQNFKRLVVISGALREFYSEHYPSISNNTIVAHDGADTPHSTILYDHKIVSDRLQVGYVGSLYNGRGLELISSLAEKCSWCDFHVIGGSNDDEKKYKQQHIPHNLTFHGQVPHGNIKHCYDKLDILLAPYQRQIATQAGNNTVRWMSPLKIFEYMSAGKAIVCSDLPVLREIMRHGDTVIFCAPDIVDDWCNALVALRDNIELRMLLGSNAQREFLTNYTWYKRARKVLENIALDEIVL